MMYESIDSVDIGYFLTGKSLIADLWILVD